MAGWVYILASAPYGTLYIGVTADLSRRIFQHRDGTGSKFCERYGVHRLIYTEYFEDVVAINLRCLDGLVIDTVQVHRVDGAKL